MKDTNPKPSGDEEMTNGDQFADEVMDDLSQDILDCGNREDFDNVILSEDFDPDDDYYNGLEDSYPLYADSPDDDLDHDFDCEF